MGYTIKSRVSTYIDVTSNPRHCSNNLRKMAPLVLTMLRLYEVSGFTDYAGTKSDGVPAFTIPNKRRG
jgi:hypothetical protein